MESVPYRHPDGPLTRGLVLARPNRFIFEADIPGTGPVRAHCPVTINISNIAFDQPLAALFSHHPGRTERGGSTDWTCQAISLGRPDAARPSWVGINQGASNRMVEHFLRTGQMPGTAPVPAVLEREVRHGSSRFDLRLDGSHYLEVKTPLNLLPQDVRGLHYGTHRRLSDTGRFRKHLAELLDSLGPEDRATVLMAFQYDAEPFREPADSDRNEEVRSLVLRALGSGRVAFRQANLGLSSTGVRLLSEFDLVPTMREWV